MEANLWEAATASSRWVRPSSRSLTARAARRASAPTRLVERIVRETTMKPAAHLTCVGAACDEIRQTLRAYHAAGVRHIVALRGDPPTGFDAPYVRAPDGYRSTAELVADATANGDFEVSVGTYPEQHPQSPTLAARHRDPEAKVDAGATRAITQFFFDNSALLSLSRRRRGGRHRRPDRARHLSRAEFQADRQFRSKGWGERARNGSPTVSTASRTIPRRAAWSPRPSAPSR